jgi:hypothetical protein
MVRNLLFKVFTRAYYFQNTGFFLVLLIGGFGFLQGQDHVALANLGLNSMAFLGFFFMTLWTLYTLKVVQFVLKSISDPKQEFLYQLRLLPETEQFGHFLSVQFALMQPIVAYGLFVAIRGVMTDAWLPVGAIALFFLLMHLIPVFWYVQALRYPNQGQKWRTFGSYIRFRFTKTYPLFFIQYLLEEQKMLLFLSKVLSCFFIVGVCKLFYTDQYDHRLISIGLLLSGLAHSSVVPLFHSFENEHLLFSWNLPLTKFKRFVQMAFGYSILLIPEFLLTIRHLPREVGWIYLPGGMSFLAGIVLVLHHYRYFNPDNQDKQARASATGFFICLLLIMFRVPVAVPGILMAGIAWILFWRHYTKVEYSVGQG